MQQKGSNTQGSTSRRSFLKTSTATLAAASVVSRLGDLPAVHAAGSDEIRIGLIGCGGRGTGAIEDAIKGAEGVKVVALADVFEDRVKKCLADAKKAAPNNIDVSQDRQFIGFDAYKQLLNLKEVNYVILATPPGFRPPHLAATVAAGKNIFTEKPVAVDGPGIRSVLASYEAAKAKGLKIGCGLQRHSQTGYLATLKKIQEGMIGQIVAARAYWNQGSLWKVDRKPGMSDMEWQMRNWYNFTWICGDHIVEQHVHNLDVINWALGATPVRAVGMGGRAQRVSPEYGHIFDHFAVDFEYANGVHLLSMCRQIPGCENSVSEALVGEKGTCNVDRYLIKVGSETKWRFAEKDNNPYVQEHTDLIAAIRGGKEMNHLKYTAESTLTAIMGRMSAYSGKAVTWEQALNSQENLMPAKLEWGSMPFPAVAVPGQTPLI
jgi:myo-inositol 2-dehydrogenase/D-chiro-inositol 1-dehydrogenase